MYVLSLLTVLVALSLVHDFAFQCFLLFLDKKISRDKNCLLGFLRALGFSCVCETYMVYLECPIANIHPNSSIIIKYRNN